MTKLLLVGSFGKFCRSVLKNLHNVFASMFPGTIQYFLISSFRDEGFRPSSGQAYP